MPWIVYVLVSRSRRTTYVGIARDVEARLAQHNGHVKGGASATRAGRPWCLGALHGPFATRAEAQSVEARVKAERGAARLIWKPAPGSNRYGNCRTSGAPRDSFRA